MNIYPPKAQLYELVRICKTTWHSHTLTVSINGKGDWTYQTGDNSFMGSCYHHPIWAVVSLPTIDDEDGEVLRSADYNCRSVVKDILEQLEEGYANSEEIIEYYRTTSWTQVTS